VADASKPTDNAKATDAGGKRSRPSGGKIKAGSKAVRTRIASVIWLVAVVCALFLAIGALLIALKMNVNNSIVSFVIDGAKKLDFGEFKHFPGSSIAGSSAATKSALVNWGIAAVIYLVIGKVLDRVVRP
jgi:hypothetical protein